MADKVTRDNFTQIPNLIDELKLSALATALYLQYARWDSVSRHRPPGIRKLRDRYNVGDDKIKAAKAELVRNGLISIVPGEHDQGRADYVKVIDIWDRNYNHFHTVKPLPIPTQIQDKKVSLTRDSPIPERGDFDQNLSMPSDTREILSLKENRKETIPEWTEIKKEIRAELSEQVFNTWFPQLHAANIDSNILTLTANEQTVDWVTKYYSELIRGKAEPHGIQDIRFEVNNER